MMAIDRTTRVESAPLHYMPGELQGGAETLQDTARLPKTLAQPFTTLQTLVESDAGKALDHFRQNSAQITVDALHQAGSYFIEAQNDPNKGGRATGKLGANILLAAAPIPVPTRLFRLRAAAELVADAPKGAPDLGALSQQVLAHPSQSHASHRTSRWCSRRGDGKDPQELRRNRPVLSEKALGKDCSRIYSVCPAPILVAQEG